MGSSAGAPLPGEENAVSRDVLFACLSDQLTRLEVGYMRTGGGGLRGMHVRLEGYQERIR